MSKYGIYVQYMDFKVRMFYDAIFSIYFIKYI